VLNFDTGGKPVLGVKLIPAISPAGRDDRAHQRWPDEDIGHGGFREIKAADGRRSALYWSWFRRPFHSDCNYGGGSLNDMGFCNSATPAKASGV
jgi:hypothetical protein